MARAQRSALSLPVSFSWLEQCIRLNQPDVLTDAYVCFGHYQLAVGDLEGTRASMQKADQIAQQIKVDRWILCWLEDLRLRSWLAEGKPGGGQPLDPELWLIARWTIQLSTRPASSKPGTGAGGAGCFGSAAIFLLRRGLLLDRLRIAAERAGWVHEQIRVMVLQVINEQAFWNRGDGSESSDGSSLPGSTGRLHACLFG